VVEFFIISEEENVSVLLEGKMEKVVMEVKEEEFAQKVLDAEIPFLVDFWAPWCGPCQAISPVIEEIARKYQGKIGVCKVNVDEAPQLASEYGVMSIPTLMLFKEGKVVDKIIGAVSKGTIESMLESVL